MLGSLLGRKKPFLEPEDEAWMVEACRWLLRHLGGVTRLRQIPLVKPNATFFPPTEATGEARAEHIFAAVKRHAGMPDWPCRLVAQAPRPELRVGEVLALKPVGGQPPAGTFSVAGNQAVISYDPSALKTPAALIAIFAHELAHYRLATFPEAPPGGPEMLEYCTDLATVFLGFGLFGANSAFNFAQHQDVMSQGWRWSRQGYLGEREWIFALAIFTGLRTRTDDDLKSRLKPHLLALHRKAARYLERNPQLLAEFPSG